MMPGFVRNCSRTSNTTRPAARDTALIARPEKKKTTEAPTMSPTRLCGSATFSTPVYCNTSNSPRPARAAAPPAFATAPRTASVKEPNSAVAANTAVAMAMPLVIALVVLPTASSSVSTRAPRSSMSPDISAMPCALSLTGPKVSMDTMTPTVVSSPVPASATANRDTMIEPPPSRNAP